ncbi:M6 family metalloprotease domain-containing protein [bacterium]|nr:M6 family metalloprotease domain-containing protein [candidate division CSSED10-310 bacterium]
MSVMKYTTTLFLSVAVCLIAILPAAAVPPIPGTYDPETMTFYESGEKVPLHYDSPGPMRAPEAYRGVWNFPVIFVETPDVSHTYEVSEWAQQLFTIDTITPGSFRDYYREISYQNFDIDGIAVGWIMMDYNYEHYHQNNYGFNGGAAEMAREAVIKAETIYNPDWSQFDNDGDGKVDGVLVIHMGQGGEGGTPSQIWSHVSSFAALEYDGVTISQYSIQPEAAPGGMETIGTLCHEHGHILGLPDLYDINYAGKPAPVGKYCLMAEGSDGGNPRGSKPAHMSTWCKAQLGWITPTVITQPGNWTIDAVQLHSTNNCYVINIPESQEYFLLANRWMGSTASLKFEGLPARFAGGLMIYHVDESYTWSNDGTRDFWHVVIEDATPGDGYDLANGGFASDVNNEFGRTTDPNSNGNTHPSGMKISNISMMGEQMSFTTSFEPVLMMRDYSVQPLGNNRFKLEVTVENITDFAANNLEMIIATSASNVTFETSLVSLGNVNPHQQATSGSFIFRTTDSVTGFAAFTVKARSAAYEGDNLTFSVPINPARVLIVDDDHTKAAAQNVDVFWTEALDLTSTSYQVWSVWTNGIPFYSMLSLYDVVIWCDGIGTNSTPKAGESLDVITKFLDAGGDLIWSSHEFLYSQYKYPNQNDYVETQPGEFAHDYLHIVNLEQDEYIYTATGIPGTITAGMNLQFEDVYSDDPTGQTGDYNWWPDEFTTDGTCIPILIAGDHWFPPGSDPDWQEDALPENNVLNNATCAMLYQGQYRLMFMSVPLQGLPLDAGLYPNTRQEFLTRVLAWFGLTDNAPGLDIDVNTPMLEAGDTCHLTLKLVNPGPAVDLQLFIALEAYGMWLFGPSWTETVSYYPTSLPAMDRVTMDVFPPFAWPSGAGSGTVNFWTVALNAANSQMIGNYDFTPLSWQ